MVHLMLLVAYLPFSQRNERLLPYRYVTPHAPLTLFR